MAAITTAVDLSPLLILYNVQKRKNFGDLMRTAAAFGAREIIVVGMRKLLAMGSHRADKSLRFTHAATLESAISYAREQHGAHICGIEIVDGAQPVATQPFRGRTAFMVGNEGHGMPDAQLAACEYCVYIPQYSAATASLNVNCAAAIVLDHYARWAQLQEAPREGYKYLLNDVPPSCVPYSGMGLHNMRSLGDSGAGRAGGADDGGGESGSDSFDAGEALRASELGAGGADGLVQEG